jgi:molecular chaperone DnaK
LQRLRTAMEGDDAEAIKQASEELMQASHKVAEAMYQQATRDTGAEAAQERPGEAAAGGADSDEEVVEAEFEEVDEDKK